MDNLIYSWDFEDKKYRSGTWYIIFLSIMLGLVLWGFLTKQYGMSFVIILLSGLMYFMDNNSEDQIFVEISELGIRVSDNFYDYARIKDYGIIYEGADALYLRIRIMKSSINQIDLTLNNDIAADLRTILPNYVAENGDSQLTFMEKMIKLLKL